MNLRLLKILAPVLLLSPLVLLLVGRDAPASDPELVQRLRAKLASSDRIFATPYFNRMLLGTNYRAVLRAEPGNGRLAIQEDSGYHSWVYMDGELTRHDPSGYFTGPRRVDRFEPLLAALLAEIHSGLAHTTFIPEVPPIPVAYFTSTPEYTDAIGQRWGSYRLDLPGPFDDAVRVYVTLFEGRRDVDDQCLVHTIQVFDQQGALVHTDPYRSPSQKPLNAAGRIIMNFDLCGYVYWNPDWQNARYGAIPPFQSRDYDVKLIEDDEYGDMLFQ